jgi:hypothetical protein
VGLSFDPGLTDAPLMRGNDLLGQPLPKRARQLGHGPGHSRQDISLKIAALIEEARIGATSAAGSASP